MKTTNTNQAATIATAAAQAAAAVINAGGTEEQAAAAVSSIMAALTNSEAAELAPMATEATKAPTAPKAPKAKVPSFHAGQWVSYRDDEGVARMCKTTAGDDGLYVKTDGGAEIHIANASDVQAHETQGQALQRRNQLAKAEAPEAPKPEAPAPEAAPEVIPADLDERAARIAKRNAAILATAPAERRRIVENKLRQAHAAGYPYARLARNKHHQMDGLHLYPGQKGHGRDAAFRALVTKAGEKYRAKADKARADGKPAPKQPARVWYWSPVGGGNLYIRGIFGEVTEA